MLRTPKLGKPRRRIDMDVAAILYTSGSTGLPKGVVLSHQNLVTGARSVAEFLENNANDVILAVLPFSFDAGFSQLSTAFSAGASVVLIDYLLPRDIFDSLSRYRVTGLSGIPSLWSRLARMDWPPEAVSHLRYVTSTGGVMPGETLRRLRENLPDTKIFLMYGLTEAFRSTYLPPEQIDRRPNSIGKAIPNAEVLVVRDDGSICEPGESGELVHRGSLVTLGYWDDPSETAKRFRPTPNQPRGRRYPEIAVYSGDTVRTDDEGYLYFVGRNDDMIKSSGYRISPTEVESVVYETGLVSECAAYGIPHPLLGQAIALACISESPSKATSNAILAACKKMLPAYMVPSEIYYLDDLPRTSNGKVARNTLARGHGTQTTRSPTT